MISQLKSRIEEVEKEVNLNKYSCIDIKYRWEIEKELKILKSCLALAEKDKEDKINTFNEWMIKHNLIRNDIIKELKTSLFGDEK